ncbi:hypothetical protein DVK02_14865 [Halobellus sp. Atlit-31R]|nr:hypothetical protein DVK02_14865 [Halobellus sp. Atlit-31R]
MTDGPGDDVDHLGEQDVKQQLDLSCTLVVNTTPGAHLEGMMACILSYRDFIKSNIQQAGGVSGPKFVSWMESATRDPADFPEPWGAKLIRMFDEALIDAVREENLPPAVVVEALDEWAEESKRDVKVFHGVPEGFFDA